MPQAFGRGRRRAGRALLLAAVLLAHAVLLGGALSLKAWGDRQPPRRDAPPLQVVLLQAPAPVAVPDRSAAARLPVRRAPQAITLLPPLAVVAPAPAAAPSTSTESPPPAAEAPSSAPPRLDLRLPRRMPGTATARNPALDDPRANTPQATMEERLSAAMGGDGRWVMERLDGDRIRYRRGNDCVEVQRSRAGQLELANGAFRNLWGAKPC